MYYAKNPEHSKTSIRSMFVSIIVILALLLTVGMTAKAERSTTADFTDGTVYVTYNTLRYLWSKPSEDANILCQIKAGTPLLVTPIEGTRYAKVTYNGEHGYVVHLNFNVLGTSQEIERRQKLIDAHAQEIPATLIQPNASAILRVKPTTASQRASVSFDLSRPIWVTESTSDAYIVWVNNSIYYLLKSDVTLLGSDSQTKVKEAYLNKQTTLFDMPDTSKGRQLATIPANTLVKPITQNNGMYRVTIQDPSNASRKITGYITIKSVWTEPHSDIPIYLKLNKATHILTVYQAKPDGTRTNTVLRTITTAIGKSSTPTLSGIYTITRRERWHQFTNSYAPFALRYAPGRYLHGPLYRQNNESTIITAYLNDFGKNVTGGCLRMPYNDILWIYYHCSDTTTILEVVSNEN